MKAKVIGTYVSLVDIVISILMIVLASTVWPSNVLLNIGFGVLGSGVVSGILTFSEYFVTKRETLEKYYLELMKIYQVLRKVKYLDTKEEVKLVAKYDWERKSDYLNKMSGKPVRENAFMELGKYCAKIASFKDEEVSMDNEQVSRFLKAFSSKIKKEIDKTLESFLEIDNISLLELDSAYASIYFMTDVWKPKKYKSIVRIYEIFQVPIRKLFYDIQNNNSHFRLYNAGETDNLPIVVQKIEENNNQLFSKEEKSNVEGKWSIVRAQFADELCQYMEQFRCKIYHERYEPIEMSYVSATYQKEADKEI